jgi:hypothetical protein
MLQTLYLIEDSVASTQSRVPTQLRDSSLTGGEQLLLTLVSLVGGDDEGPGEATRADLRPVSEELTEGVW